MTLKAEIKNPARGNLLSLAGFAMAALALFAGVESAWAQDVFPPEAYAGYVADKENGKYMFAAAGCAACHASEADPTLLSGGLEMRSAVGTFRVPNISPDPENGIGGWSNARFLNAVMRGLKEDGSHLYPVMPYTSYSGMKPEDALDIKAYIDTLPASGKPNEGHQVGVPFNFNITLAGWKAANPFVEDYAPFNRESMDPSAYQMKRGEYLVRAVGHCAECHTGRKGFDWGLDHSKEFQGETGLTGSYADPITPEALKAFKPTDFTVSVLQQGKKLRGEPITDPTMGRLARGWTQLNQEDRVAIYAYLTGAPVTLPDPNTDAQVVAQVDPVKEPGGQTDPVDPADPCADPASTDASCAAIMPVVSEGVPLNVPYCAADEAMALAALEQPQPNLEPITVAPVAVVETGPSELDVAADAFIRQYCHNCHGPGTRYNSLFPAGSITSIANNPAFVTKGDPSKSLLYQSVSQGRMPKGEQPTREEIENLGAWISSLNQTTLEPVAVIAEPVKEQPKPAVAEIAAPTPRSLVTREDELEAAVRDIDEVDELDRPYIRYFSLRAQYNAVYPCESDERFKKRLAVFQAGFLKLLNSLSYGPKLTSGVPVEGSNGLLLRIDMRDLEWTPEKYDALVAQYAYGVDPRSDAQLNTLAEETDTVLPIMRADWFMSFATKPELYAVMLDLPNDIRIVEDRLGVDVNANIERRDIIRGAFLEGSSGVSDHNRMVERHDIPNGGYYWKSYDFAGSTELQNLKDHPHGPADPHLALPYDLTAFHHDGGEMIFSLPNGLQAYYLSKANGEVLFAGPTSIVSFRERPIGKGVEVLNGRSCMNCHYDGMIFKRDELRDIVDVSPQFSLDERELLLSIYVPEEELTAAYQGDRDKFVAALDQIGATVENQMGVKTSMPGPSGEESINYFADHYEADLALDALAAEFDMSPDEFKQMTRRIRDPEAYQLVNTWMALLDTGLLVPRAELEAQYPYLLGALMRLDPLQRYLEPEAEVYAAAVPEYQQTIVEQYTEQGTGEYVEQIRAGEQQNPELYATAAADKMTLSLKVPATDVKVNQRLAFEITSNKDCEAQMFYVESTGNVVPLDAAVGDANLRAGQPKQIPDPASKYELMFNAPGYEESLVVYCRAGGLGDRRLTPEQASKLVAEGKQGSRGLVVQLSDRASEKPAAEATHMVTFNVTQ